jgi:pentatricopeptide repeat protein
VHNYISDLDERSWIYNSVFQKDDENLYIILATACYRASDSTITIDRATRFVDEMKNKGKYVCTLINRYELLLFNIVGFRIEYRTFNALIAAFGKRGQLKMSVQLVDEMVEVGFIPNEDTYVSLLIARNPKKNTGFEIRYRSKRKKIIF